MTMYTNKNTIYEKIKSKLDVRCIEILNKYMILLFMCLYLLFLLSRLEGNRMAWWLFLY